MLRKIANVVRFTILVGFLFFCCYMVWSFAMWLSHDKVIAAAFSGTLFVYDFCFVVLKPRSRGWFTKNPGCPRCSWMKCSIASRQPGAHTSV